MKAPQGEATRIMVGLRSRFGDFNVKRVALTSSFPTTTDSTAGPTLQRL